MKKMFGDSFPILPLIFFSENVSHVLCAASPALSAWLKYSAVSLASVSTLCHAGICLHSVSITTACQGHVAPPVFPENWLWAMMSPSFDGNSH